ncbi:WYL domain-containing protein [Streptomyces sp. TRM72054]|uniref:WYL domain-containing protein n=1 Tax=Streptomyces sp. TRM72054 TaxID=2870562 RepID=UPI001C8C00F1|nr:WYL domain-containing protein [Streptomyces sp. TRM72054]MBX9392264.1 WYL domain-containing protein [Streptomyces sp. TRM72054]
MRHTANETSTTTLTRLITALDKQQPVTVTYVKADGTTTVRTVELYDITVSNAGDILLKAMDRETGEARSFRVDRIQAYTIHRTAYTVPRTTPDDQTAPELATVTVLYAEEPSMTQGQQFAQDMRHFLSIGTRTRRDRKGLDLHREIADWVRTAAMERGTLDSSQEESFRPAYDAACSWYKWIKLGRASYLVIEHINALSPYQFCALLGDMIDAEVKSTSQGGQYFERMRAELLAQAS